MGSNVRKCIFHFPGCFNTGTSSGSSIRPQKMIHAFEECGYEVVCVMGYGAERKEQIKQIKRRIRSGVQFDFVYSESSTTPTLLTEKNHFPRYPLLDFCFLKYCKKQGMKIGLFYRDIYWKFPIYKKEVSWWKRFFSIPLYQYDLRMYKKIVDILYLPSKKMYSYVNIPVTYETLPPGCEWDETYLIKKMEKLEKAEKRDRLSLFYVGGVGDIYDLRKLLNAVKDLEFVQLVVCCRQKEWQLNKNKYLPFMCERVKIIHKSGKELEDYYLEADLGMLFFSSSGYRAFAMPVKLFEYISRLLPVIAVKDSSAGEFVEENGVGWSIFYDEEELKDVLRTLFNNQDIFREKAKHILEVLKANTWKRRAERVVDMLKNNKIIGEE